MLSDPGSHFRWSLAPFRQLDVGPAHPAVGWVLGCTLFSCFYLFLILSFMFILFICAPHVPAFLGSLGFFYDWITRDMTSDLIPLGFPSSHFQDSVCYMACGLDSCSYSFQR